MNREPVVIIAFVQALIALAVAFGLDLTPEQTAGIIAAVTAVLALVARQMVTPVADPKNNDGTPLTP